MTLSSFQIVKRKNRTSNYNISHLTKNSAHTTPFPNERPQYIPSYINAFFVGDRSGSMLSMGSAPQEGVVEFITNYKELAENNPHSTIYVTIITFDKTSHTAYSGLANDITQSITNDIYNSMIPRSTTRLFDTAIEAILEQQNQLTKYVDDFNKKHSEIVSLGPNMASSFTLLTDGDDNESSTTSFDLKTLVSEHEKLYNTSCLFAAANQDALLSGTNYGFSQNNSLQIGSNEDDARAAFRSCTQASIRSATNERSGYNQAEREQSCSMDIYDNYHDYQDHYGVQPCRY